MSQAPGETSIFPIVALGASAGGLAAFEAFFRSMDAEGDPGMAFVLLQHLAAEHHSLLAEIIQRQTRMQVVEVTDGILVRPDHVYVIPPAFDMTLLDGKLRLLASAPTRGPRLPIDTFFTSLAQQRREHAIAIVLSGTGNDGTLGARAIKAEGGMVMAQSPASCEFDGMPRSVIAAGQVDCELPPADMPARLLGYVSRTNGTADSAAIPVSPHYEMALQGIFALLRARTRHDFSGYKAGTVVRRIVRRIALHQIDTIEGYLKFLEQNGPEVQSLFRDLLIGVTRFFRDPQAFLALENSVIAQIFSGKTADAPARVWVPGCSTGEEAYSIAILLQERAAALGHPGAVQIFATDIDAQAIATARAGLYPASIAADMSPKRLASCFCAEHAGSAYRVNKAIRDMLVFSEQDVIQDPPFSNLDLVSCRNLLIYMGAQLHTRLIPLFHYALNPGGALFLGSSESLGECADMFTTVDRTARLYRRREVLRPATRAGIWPFASRIAAIDTPAPRANRRPARGNPSLRETMEQALLRHAAPVGALVNRTGEIVYLHGRSGGYLEPSPGEAGPNNILKMAREGLRQGLATALQQAAASGTSATLKGQRVRTNGHYTTVNIGVYPVSVGAAPLADQALYAVILESGPDDEPAPSGESSAVAAGAGDAAAAGGADAARDPRVTALQEELRAKDEFLQASTEALETSNEELKNSNEELQSVNEELQSTNEELETSKEELQSVNEELATVNAELQTKVVELSRTNNDMNNLLAGSGIATVFLDSRMRIMRFTPAAAGIINLVPGDVGRPVGHIVANLTGYDRFISDVKQVLDTLVPIECDVRTTTGLWYSMRIQPYRTLENVIEGAVINFVNITEVIQGRNALSEANALLKLAAVVRDSQDAVIVHDLHGLTLAWNAAAVRLYGWSEAEALGMNLRDRIPPALRAEELELLRRISEAQGLEPQRTQRLCKDGRSVDVSVLSTALLNAAGQIYAICTTERPLAAPIRPTGAAAHG
jgi:two-component system CheB/CheR fusion protein